jgi:hypothetical protein
MFRKSLLLGLLAFFAAFSIHAQNSESHHYRTEDSAVAFDYAAAWTVEAYRHVFDTSYEFALLTPAYNPFQNPADRSQIFIEIINPENKDFAENMETAEDFADYTIREGFGRRVNLEEVEIAGMTGVRSEVISNRDRDTILFAFVLENGWMIIASINAPQEPLSFNDNDIDNGESDLLALLESLEFDVTAAETVFERNLDAYDTSDIELGESYTSDDGLMIFAYPEDWEMLQGDGFGAMVGTIGYIYEFSVDLDEEDAELYLMVFEVGNGYYNQPMDANTPEEYLHKMRNSENGTVSEFRIGNYDAVSLVSRIEGSYRQEISYALNEEWIVLVSLEAASEHALEAYEAGLVAMIATIQFTVGASFIEFPMLSVTLPEPWEVATASTSSEGYNIKLQSGDREQYQDASIFIYLRTLESADLLDAAEGDLEDLMAGLSPVEFETSIIEIGDYEVLQSEIQEIEGQRGGLYAAVSLIRLDEDWFFFAVSQSVVEDEVQSILADVETIIAEMEISLSEE